MDDQDKAKAAFKLVAENTKIEFGLINYETPTGESKSALVTAGDPSTVPASDAAKALFDTNGNAVKEINHNHPGDQPPSGYDAWGDLLTPITGDAKNAVGYPNNSKGESIKRGVYRPGFNKITQYDNQGAKKSSPY